jgi:hypothetical protein
MARLWRRHGVPRSGWRRTAQEAASRRLLNSAAGPTADLAPDPSEPGDAVIIETAVLARLLGVKLLTLEGTVVLSPASAHMSASRQPALDGRTAGRGAVPLARTPEARAASAAGSLGGGLADARRLLADSAATLDGHASGPTSADPR